MHDKALAFLQRLSEKEDDKRDKLQPTVTYLQRLGPEYLDLIFKFSQWALEQDREIAFEVFSSVVATFSFGVYCHPLLRSSRQKRSSYREIE
jgi:hypothetical protein